MSEVIVLDTHIWFWFISQELDRFPASWRDEIETVVQVGVSPVSCYEIALAHQRGRLELPDLTSKKWTYPKSRSSKNLGGMFT
jgi:PIN domain nuclease of toxin-antitoxin system